MPAREKEELDKEWIELLNELRVVLPGVQVLFAFLLAAPFRTRFNSVTEGDRSVDVVLRYEPVIDQITSRRGLPL